MNLIKILGQLRDKLAAARMQQWGRNKDDKRVTIVIPAEGRLDFVKALDAVLAKNDVRRPEVGQCEFLPVSIWLLIDRDNGNPGSRRYCWWFPTKREALEHKAWQETRPNSASLSGPYKFIWEGP